MTDPTAVGLGFVAFALLVLAIRYLQVRLTHSARPERVTPTVARDAATTCNAQHPHYYRKAFADMWRCVNCGHLQPVSAEDVLDAAAEDFRDELPHIESYANKECDA